MLNSAAAMRACEKRIEIIECRQCAFHRAMDEPCALPLSPPKGGSKREFLANVNSSSRSLHAIARPSVVCNVGALYSAGWNFRQFFFAVWYLGHLLTFTENFTEIVPGEPLRRGI